MVAAGEEFWEPEGEGGEDDEAPFTTGEVAEAEPSILQSWSTVKRVSSLGKQVDIDLVTHCVEEVVPPVSGGDEAAAAAATLLPFVVVFGVAAAAAPFFLPAFFFAGIVAYSASLWWVSVERRPRPRRR